MEVVNIIVNESGDQVSLQVYDTIIEDITENNVEIVEINVDESPDGLSNYQIAVRNGFIGTEEEWLLSLEGAEVMLQNNGTHIQWKYTDDLNWINLIALIDLKGDKGDRGDQGLKGDTGASIELQKSLTHVQWRVVGSLTWLDLIPLSELKGDKGDLGTTGDSAYDLAVDLGYMGTEEQWIASLKGVKGDQGNNGKEIELQKTATHIQWRYVGDISWVNLVPLIDITGADGREVEFNKSAIHIQWRYVGSGTWIDLVPLTDIKGDTGSEGLVDYEMVVALSIKL